MKRVLSLLLAALLLLSLAACGGGAGPGPATPTALTSFDRESTLCAMLPTEDGRVLLSFGGLTDAPDPADRMYQQTMVLLDPESDRILFEAPTHSGAEEDLLGVLQNGDVLPGTPTPPVCMSTSPT